MRIALVQRRIVDGGKMVNARLGVEAVRAAARDGAELVCFAELAFEEFYPQRKAAGDYLELAEEVPGPVTEMFCEVAKEVGVVIVLNLYERVGGCAFDCSPVIDGDGRLLGRVRMVHITDYENF